MPIPFQAGCNTVEWTSAGETVRGHLFLPPHFDLQTRLAGIVVAPTWTSVKEQMSDLYAQRLSEHGFAVLSFDFRFYGESGGEPRQYEAPLEKAVDITNAVTFLVSLPFIDGERIGGLGVCAGCGYMAQAAAQDSRIKSLAFVAPWLHNEALLEQMYGGAEGVQQRKAAAQVARQHYQATGEVDTVPAASATDPDAAMSGPFDYYFDPARGNIAAYHNVFAVMSWTTWLGFDAVSIAPHINVPVVMVHSEDAAIPDGARQFFQQLTAAKDFFWTQGTQFDFYDQEPQVTKSVRAAATQFETTLAR